MSHNPDPRRESGVSPHGSAGLSGGARPSDVEQVGETYSQMVMDSITAPGNVVSNAPHARTEPLQPGVSSARPDMHADARPLPDAGT